MKKRMHMKNGVCMTLLLCMLLSVMLSALPALQTAADGAEETEWRNVALDCAYTTSTEPYTQDADKHENNYRNKNFDELTDGIKGQSDMGSEWSAFTADTDIVIDLGKTVNRISLFTAQFCSDTQASVILPKGVTVYGSAEKDSGFVEIGKLQDTTEAGQMGYHEYALDLKENTVSYRYIKLNVQKAYGFCMFLSEVEVFAGYISELSFTDLRAFVKDDQVHGISAKTNVSAWRTMVNSTMGVSVTDKDGKVKESGYFATGDKIVKNDANGQPKAYTVIIDGDVDGDGTVSAVDYFALKRFIMLDNGTLKGCYLDAGDCDANGKCEANDYFFLKRHFFGLADLYAKYEPDLYSHVKMSYDIPDQYNDGYEDPFDAKAYEKMDVELKNGTYTVTYHYEDGATWSVDFVQKRWGVWMLGAMTYKTAAGKVHAITDSSTDYEWVMHCGADTAPTFRGGNHGDYTLSAWNKDNSADSNDKLLDVTFYDAKSGNKLTIASGQKLTVDGLRIVLHNNVYEKTYEQSNVLINVEKQYLFNGAEVQVASKLNVVKDTRFTGSSYSAMLPIKKEYGNYVRLYSDGQAFKTVQTPLVGKNNYGDSYSNNNDATRVEFWGENNPACHMNVEILNAADQLYHSEKKVRIWDMNPYANKVYFSMFKGTGETVEKGTEWNFVTKWSFEYLPDFQNPDSVDEKLGFQS